MESQSQEEKKETCIKTTLGALDGQLAFGVVDGNGGQVKSLAVRRWKMAEEKELGKLRSQNKDANMAEYVSMVLATMLTQCGPHDFTKISLEERRVYLSNMWAGDIFTAYCHLRAKAMGKVLALEVKCPGCKNKFKFEANLDTTVVNTAGDIEDLKWEYPLDEPITLRGKEITGFIIGPARWNTMENIVHESADIGTAKAGIIAGSIHGLIGCDGPVAISANELDDLVKSDIEKITSRLDDKPLGPEMSIELKCDKCYTDMVQPIEWDYDHFFGISSR